MYFTISPKYVEGNRLLVLPTHGSYGGMWCYFYMMHALRTIVRPVDSAQSHRVSFVAVYNTFACLDERKTYTARKVAISHGTYEQSASGQSTLLQQHESQETPPKSVVCSNTPNEIKLALSST